MFSKRLETTTPNKYIDVKMDYRKGGMNYFTSQVMKRGYYIGVTPVTIEGGFRTMTAFTGYCACVLEVKRASLRDELRADDLARAKMEELVQAVCQKNGLTLK